MSHVFVIDADKKPLTPVHPGEARRLLTAGKAAVFRRYPFVIILKAAMPDITPEPLRVKIDPGSTTTGLALVNDATGERGLGRRTYASGPAGQRQIGQ